MNLIEEKLAEANDAVGDAEKQYHRVEATLTDVADMQAKAKKYLALLENRLPEAHAAYHLGEVLEEEVQDLENRAIITRRLIENDYPLATTGLTRRTHAACSEVLKAIRYRDKIQKLQEHAQELKEGGQRELGPIRSLKEGITSLFGREDADLYVETLLAADKQEQDPDSTGEVTDKGDGDQVAGKSLLTPEKLKGALKDREMSINAFSKAAGMNQSFVSRVLRGEKMMSKALSDKAFQILKI